MNQVNDKNIINKIFDSKRMSYHLNNLNKIKVNYYFYRMHNVHLFN